MQLTPQQQALLDGAQGETMAKVCLLYTSDAADE